MSGHPFTGRIGLQQRVIPTYRAEFIETLAQACPGGLSVFAGEPTVNESIFPVEGLHWAQYIRAENRYFREPSSPAFLCWQGGFHTWLKSWQPEVLIVEANPRYPATRLAISWMHRRKGKVIGWGLGAPSISGSLAKIRRWERLNFLRSLDAVVAYSRLGAEQYRQLGFPAEKIYVASNATAHAPSGSPPEKPDQFENNATILFVGRLQSRKRLDLLLQACSFLPASLKPKVEIIGDGPARNDFEKLASLIYPQAEFLGAIHGEEINPFFAKADLFVLPGTGGLAIQQAMAHALPIIVARGDGTQDDLVSSENGWLVPPDDLQALTEALRDALSNPARLRQMGIASYRIVSEEINIEKMVEVFCQAIKDIRLQKS